MIQAINAATQDPRFDPMKLKELDNVVFEVSVLTPPEQVETDNPKEYVKHIKVGEDGLIIERGHRKGLLVASGDRLSGAGAKKNSSANAA